MSTEIARWPDIAQAAAQTGLAEAEIHRLVRERKLKKRTRQVDGAAVVVVDPASPAQVPLRSEVLSGLESAFWAFLQAPRQTEAAVPVERRIFLTLAESAQFSGLPVGYLRKLMADGLVKSVRTGAGWRIPRTELERLPEVLTSAPAPKEGLSDAEERDLATNKLRRQGRLPQG